MTGKLDVIGREYLKIFSDELDIVEQDSIYRVSGTDASGRPISTTLTAEDLNSGSGTNFSYVMGVVSKKQNARKTEPGRGEHRILSPEELDAHRKKRKREMGMLLDIAKDPEKYVDEPKDSE